MNNLWNLNKLWIFAAEEQNNVNLEYVGPTKDNFDINHIINSSATGFASLDQDTDFTTWVYDPRNSNNLANKTSAVCWVLIWS